MITLLRSHFSDRLEPERAPRARQAKARGAYVGLVEAVARIPDRADVSRRRS